MHLASDLAAYPFDTVSRRMMMTSAETVYYENAMECSVQIIKQEGFLSLMRGAGRQCLEFDLDLDLEFRLSSILLPYLSIHIWDVH